MRATALFIPALGCAPFFAKGSGPDRTVDLGYARYTGTDAGGNTTGLTVWRGIRYAAAPVDALRWQAPRSPPANLTAPIRADTFGPACPQTYPSLPGVSFMFGDEDCLFLNVYAPTSHFPDANATARRSANDSGLPVFVSIHGGGYGLGDGTQDMTALVGVNDNSFVAVTIQYRLGVFGFLSSADVKAHGVLNAGLLDQEFALKWVQAHISKFGGDPDRVTIAGESAGAGSVLLHAIARNGSTGTRLFKNIIAASPWIPTQPAYNDEIPTRYYDNFVQSVGCSDSDDVFACLISTDSRSLQYAANQVSITSTPYGNWAFIPVTGGEYVAGYPSRQLAHGSLNGLRVLVGNNANEGPVLVPPTIVSQDDLVDWIRSRFPYLSDRNVTRLLEAYPSVDGPVNASDVRFETDGYGPITAVNTSQMATGQQQRAYNIYAEAAVVCPSYWLASAFSGPGRVAYHYQYSVPFAVHGADLTAYYGPPTANQGPDLAAAFQKIYGAFITGDNPSIPATVANGPSSLDRDAPSPASNWPAWTHKSPALVNLNQTGGTPYQATVLGVALTQFREPGLRNNFTVADASLWEGGRGRRCEVWRELSPYIPQ